MTPRTKILTALVVAVLVVIGGVLVYLKQTGRLKIGAEELTRWPVRLSSTSLSLRPGRTATVGVRTAERRTGQFAINCSPSGTVTLLRHSRVGGRWTYVEAGNSMMTSSNSSSFTLKGVATGSATCTVNEVGRGGSSVNLSIVVSGSETGTVLPPPSVQPPGSSTSGCRVSFPAFPTEPRQISMMQGEERTISASATGCQGVSYSVQPPAYLTSPNAGFVEANYQPVQRDLLGRAPRSGQTVTRTGTVSVTGYVEGNVVSSATITVSISP